MENTILIIISTVLFILLSISLYFLFKKKETNSTLILKEERLEIEEKEKLKEEQFEKVISEAQTKLEIERLELEKLAIEKQREANEKSTKSIINISSKTEKQLLKKLEQFEANEIYLKKDITLNALAKQFKTNTRYLSDIIKTYKNKNFNQYINELRINNLVDKLNTDEKVLNTKVSYLANDFGFNSHSSFSTLFTQYVGKSPSDYIKELKTAKKAQKTEQ